MNSDKSNNLPKPPKLIRNKPSEDDEFAGGAHTRIARTVCSLIDADNSGMAIALVGKWGSGKSTTVSLVQKLLRIGLPRSGQTNVVFHFDAWAHHGDPMRRALIEKLVRDLGSEGVIDEDEFKLDLAELRGDTVEVIRDIHTSISGWSLIFWVAALMLPLGYMLLDPANWSKSLEPGIEYIGLGGFEIAYHHLGAVILSLPVMLGFIAWIAMRPTLNPKSPKFWTLDNLKKKKPKYKNQNIVTLLLNKGENKRLHEITRTQEPTTIQLNKLFDRVVGAVRSSDRRLVLVIDNIDRLPPILAMETWATLRNFFARGLDHERRDVLGCVSTVVTLSTESLRNILSDTFYATDEGEVVFDQLSSDALGKTFDAVFYIPDTVATDWRNFLHDKLSIVLPDLSDVELQDLYSIIDVYFSEKGRQPTPRRLVTFVNEVSILHHEWSDFVDVQSVGAFVLHRAQISDDLRPLRAGNLISERTAVLLGDRDWRLDFAILHLHLPPEKALQTVLGAPVRFALEQGDVESFEELWATEGASLTLASVLQEGATEWAKKDPATFFTACHLLGGIDGVDATCWRILGDSASRVERWGRIAVDSGAGVESLLLNGPSYRVVTIASSVVSSLGDSTSIAGEKEEIAKRFASVIASVSRCVEKRASSEEAIELLKEGTVPGDAAFYLSFAHAACAESFQFWLLTQEAPPSDVTALLIEQASQGSLGENVNKVFSGLIETGSEFEWPSIFDALVTYIIDEGDIAIERALNYVEGLAVLSNRNRGLATQKKLNESSKSGFLLRHFLTSEQPAKRDLLSARIAVATFAANPNVSFPPTTGKPHEEQVTSGRKRYEEFLESPLDNIELVGEMARIALEHLQFDEICSRAGEGVETSELAAAIAAQIVELRALTRYNDKWMLTNFGTVIDVIGEEHSQELIEQVDSPRRLSRFLSKTSVTDVDPDFVVRVLESDSRLKNVLAKEIDGYLQALEDDDWTSALGDENSNALRLYADYDEAGFNFTLRASAKLPLYSHFQSILKGDTSANGARFVSLIESLPNGSRKSLLKDMASDLSRSTESSAPGLVTLMEIMGETIIKSLIALKDRQGEVLRNVICRLIQERAVSTVDLLIRHKKSLVRLTKKASADDRQYFEEVIAEISDDEEDWLPLRAVLD